MQETKVKCDFCRNSVPEGESVEVRIDDKLHDLCKGCSDKLEKILRGTGRAIPEPPAQVLADWAKILGGQQVEITPAIGITPPVIIPSSPNSPPWQPNAVPYWGEPNTGVWMNVSNVQGGGIQTSGFMTTATSSSDPLIGKLGTEFDKAKLNAQMALVNSLLIPKTPSFLSMGDMGV